MEIAKIQPLPNPHSETELITTASLIGERATNHYALSTSKFYAGFAPILKNDLLRAFDFSKFDSCEAIVETVFLTGSLVQKSAILSTLDATCDLSTPELKAYNREVAQEALRASILQVCDFFGKGFEGNLDQYVVSLYDSYGGLSIMEWMRFFNDVTRGKYKEDYQHISVRGLNAEFLNDWVEKFGHKRDDIVQSLRKELPDIKPASSGEDLFSFETYKELQREEIFVESRVRDWRTKLEAGLTFRRMQLLEIPTQTSDGTTVEKQSVPMVIDQPGASYKRLLNFLDVYYTPFVDLHANSKDVIDCLMVQWDLELKYWAEGEHVGLVPDQKVWYAQQAKVILCELEKIVSCFDLLLLTGIKKLSERHTTTHALWLACGGLVDYPAQDRAIEESDIRFIKNEKMRIFASKYTERMKQRIESGAFLLFRKEFYSLCAISFYVKVAGLEHPFSHFFCTKK